MVVDDKTNSAAEANETGETQSKKAAKKLAKEAAKAAKVIIWIEFKTKFCHKYFFDVLKSNKNKVFIEANRWF